MALEHFILLLLLVPCIAVNIDQIDSAIDEQGNMDDVFQDSITYLMKQRSIMQAQLENVSSHCSMNCTMNTMNTTMNDERLQSVNTEIGTLKHNLEKLSQRVIHLLQKEDKKLNDEIETRKHDLEKLSQRIIQLSQEEDKKLNDEIQTRKHDLEKLSQRESAVQTVLMKQSKDIGLLFTKMNEIKDIKHGMAQLMKYITDSATRSEQHLSDLKEELNRRMDHEKNNTMTEVMETNAAIKSHYELLWKRMNHLQEAIQKMRPVIG